MMHLQSLRTEVQSLLQTAQWWHTDKGAYLQKDTTRLLISSWKSTTPDVMYVTLTVASLVYDVNTLDGLSVALRSRSGNIYIGCFNARGSLLFDNLPRGEYWASVNIYSSSITSQLPMPFANRRLAIFPTIYGTPQSYSASSAPEKFQVADLPLQIEITKTVKGSTVVYLSCNDRGMDGAVAACVITDELGNNLEVLLVPLAWDESYGLAGAQLDLAELHNFMPGFLQGLWRPEDLTEDMVNIVRTSVQRARPYTRYTWSRFKDTPTVLPIIRAAITEALGEKG